jgi:hypothetical protein
MLNLGLSVFCSVLIANLLMLWNSKHGAGIMAVFLGNYFLATLFSLSSIPRPFIVPPALDLSLGVIAGAFFLLNFWVYQRCITHNGLSLSVGAMRVSMLIPILISVLVFHDGLNTLNGIGIVLALAAFALRADPKQLRKLLWVLALFTISGSSEVILKIYKELGAGLEPHFVLLTFSSAFLITGVIILLGKVPVIWQAVLFGCVLGIPNRLSTVFFLRGLDSVPAPIAYPFVAASIVLLSIVSDIVIWKQQATRRDALLWLMLILSLVLMNYK